MEAEEKSTRQLVHTILLATDGSPHARKALSVAADLARQYNAHVVILTAYDPLARDLGSPHIEDLTAKRMAEAEGLIREAAAVLEKLGVVHEETVLEGPAADAILRAAHTRGCDMIVMGSRGLGPLPGLVLGSVSQRVVQEATCPVLIVR